MELLKASKLISLSISDRAELILEHTKSVDIPPHLKDENEDIQRAYRISKILTAVLPDFFRDQIQRDQNEQSVLNKINQSNLISQKCKEFETQFIQSMLASQRTPQDMISKPLNLYEMCGAAIFAQSNSISRKLSTKMGKLWEKIVNISPYAVSPEQDFGLRINGIDSIIFPEGEDTPIFIQLKTARGTLTGSQAPRSKRELGLHQKALFAAAFSLGNWTFLSPDIPRACGDAFWSMIKLDYDILKDCVKEMILKIESAYVEEVQSRKSSRNQ
jgi:hypothetical protein